MRNGKDSKSLNLCSLVKQGSQQLALSPIVVKSLPDTASSTQ